MRRATTSGCPQATRTSRSRRAGLSRSTWRSWPSLRICTSSADDMHMSVRLPNGRTQNLIEITDWDPSWQRAYHFQKPITLARRGQSSTSSHTSTTQPTHATPTSHQRWSRRGSNSTTRCASATSLVVKKGQDLTAPGARDDLFEIFSKQRERLFRMMATKKRR